MTAIALQDFDTKLNTAYCIDNGTRDVQVAEAVKRITKRVQPLADVDGKRVAVVCYGPSLEETWPELKSGYDVIITCSGAHKFLLDRGIIPTYHVEVDPRKHKADLIGTPHKAVQYLCASVCHKAVFDLLEGHDVALWHIFAMEAARENIPVAYPRGEWAITGGSCVGLRCLTLARFLGFRDLTIYGMDFSFRHDGSQHADWHPKEPQVFHAVEVGGEVFYTNPPMNKYAQEFFKEVSLMGKCNIQVKGRGLLQAMVKQRGIPTEERIVMIGATLPKTLSDEYLAQNRALHETRPDYGVSGAKRAEVVMKLVESVKPKTILDYGCGKGTLAAALPFPIWEYDPAIPGKDATPRPADLVICTDVLEHIEPEYLPAALFDLQRCVLSVGYFLIHTGPAMKTLPDGRNAHLIQESMDWWKDKLSAFFDVGKIEQVGNEITAIVGKKTQIKPVITSTDKPALVAPPMDFSRRVTPVRIRGTEVKFYTPNDQTYWRATSLERKEPATIEWIESFQPGETLWDVGANVGGYTVWAAKRRGVKVVAFEPEANNYALLCRNIDLNEIDATAYCLALSDEFRLDALYITSHDPGNSCNTFGRSLGFDLKERKSIRQGAIGMRMDDLWRGAPDHIKLDVDGLEYKVIAGGPNTLKDVKSLLVEVNENLPEHRKMIADLEGMGFTFDPSQVDKARRKDGPFKGCAEYVFRKKNAVEDAFLERIRGAAVISKPFPHLYIEDVFPAEFFAQLQAAIPDDGWESLEAARNTKDYPDRFVHKAPSLVAWMKSGRLKALLDEKFGVKSGKEEVLLLSDKTGYTIPPHTDHPVKSITALFYVTRDWTPEEHGTSLYSPLIKSFRDPTGAHHDKEGFRLEWTAPGKPNSCVIFARSDTSFHGVETYTGSRKREILLWDSRK